MPEPYRLTPEVEERIDQIVAELPALTPEQLDTLADTLTRIRLRIQDEADQ